MNATIVLEIDNATSLKDQLETAMRIFNGQVTKVTIEIDPQNNLLKFSNKVEEYLEGTKAIEKPKLKVSHEVKCNPEKG